MEIGLRIIGFLLLIIDLISQPFFWFRSRKPSLKLPPIKDPILSTSATKLAHLIRNQEISSLQVIESFIKRTKEVNPFLNAIVEERFNDAICEAKNVDKLLETLKGDEAAIKKLMIDKPLLGVPLTVKESCSMSGMSLSVGSKPRIGVKATNDCQVVSLIRRSGAIPILVSNTPELCLSWESNNLVTGKTSNPYCLHRTSGGSSGGEAALIGSGASIIGIASDIAGSIRIPAMFTGIFGHKPTPGIVSIDGHYPTSTDENFSKFLTIGPLTRYSEDLEIMLKVMAGQNVHRLNLGKKVNLQEIKVSYMLEAGKSILMIPVENEIQAVMKKAIDYLNIQCGSEILEMKFDELKDSLEISVSVFFGMQDIPNLLQDEINPKRSKNVYIELFKSLLGIGEISLHSIGFYLLETTNLFIPKSSYQEYCLQGKSLRQKMKDALGEDGIFLYPTFPIPAFYHNQVFTKPAGVLYTMIFNIMGFPSTHVPLGLNSKGLPIGMQVVAGPYQDNLCLAVARELEKGFGGWIPPHFNTE